MVVYYVGGAHMISEPLPTALAVTRTALWTTTRTSPSPKAESRSPSPLKWVDQVKTHWEDGPVGLKNIIIYLGYLKLEHPAQNSILWNPQRRSTELVYTIVKEKVGTDWKFPGLEQNFANDLYGREGHFQKLPRPPRLIASFSVFGLFYFGRQLEVYNEGRGI